MRRDKLQTAMNRIKSRSPKFFWTSCDKCGEDYKYERMFYFKISSFGPSMISYKKWFCTECCHTQADVLLKNRQYFDELSNSEISSLTPHKRLR